MARAAAAISLGLEDELVLGDLDARRDWGYAGDYVRAMWLMLQHTEPGDYVVATGVSHSVEELVERAFAAVGLDWASHVRIDPSLSAARPSSTTSSATRRGPVSVPAEPEVSFEELVRLLVDAELSGSRRPASA